MIRACLLVAALLGGVAHAEPVKAGLSKVDIEQDRFTITVATDEFADRIPTENIEAADRMLDALTVETTWISVDGRACRVGNSEMEVIEGAVAISAPILCNKGKLWRYHATWLRGRDSEHRHVVHAFGEPIGVLTPASTTIDLVPQPASAALTAIPGTAWVAAGLGAGLLLLMGLLLAFWMFRYRPVA